MRWVRGGAVKRLLSFCVCDFGVTRGESSGSEKRVESERRCDVCAFETRHNHEPSTHDTPIHPNSTPFSHFMRWSISVCAAAHSPSPVSTLDASGLGSLSLPK